MIIKWLGVGILLAFSSFLLSEAGFKGKRVFAAFGAVVFFSVMASELEKIISSVMGFAEGAGITDTAKCALKIVGVGYLFGIGSDIVSELSEPGISRALVCAGKIEIILVVLPYFNDILELGLSLLK